MTDSLQIDRQLQFENRTSTVQLEKSSNYYQDVPKNVFDASFYYDTLLLIYN